MASENRNVGAMAAGVAVLVAAGYTTTMNMQILPFTLGAAGLIIIVQGYRDEI